MAEDKAAKKQHDADPSNNGPAYRPAATTEGLLHRKGILSSYISESGEDSDDVSNAQGVSLAAADQVKATRLQAETSVQCLPSPALSLAAPSPLPPSHPGAYPMRPFGDRDNNNNNNTENASVELAQEDMPSPHPTQDIHNSDIGLTEAIPVDPIPLEDLEQANPVQEEGSNKRGIYKKRYFLLLTVAFAVVVALVTVLAVDARSSSGDSIPHTVQSTIPQTNNDTHIQAALLREATLARLPNFTRSTIERDPNGVAPQTRALEWILADPLLGNYTDKRFLQRFGAATFYYATDGPNWLHQGDENVTIALEIGNGLSMVDIAPEAPWLTIDVHECHWYWTQSRKTKPVCTKDGAFLFLELSRNGLAGRLPPEIGLWEEARGIKFGWHNIGGSIPTEVGFLSNLQELRLNAGDLSGTLPTELLQASNLQALSFNDNAIHSNFFQEFWQLTNLKQLIASRSLLSGSLPESIGYRFPNMEKLVLSKVNFTGSIPDSIGQWSNLEQFMMYDEPMMIMGTIPTAFGKLTLLEELKLGSPLLSGTIPTELGRLTALVEVLFRHSPNLKGSLPSELGLLNKALESLILVNTSVTGTIPVALCGIGTLEFDCSPFKLCGCDCPC